MLASGEEGMIVKLHQMISAMGDAVSKMPQNMAFAHDGAYSSTYTGLMTSCLYHDPTGL